MTILHNYVEGAGVGTFLTQDITVRKLARHWVHRVTPGHLLNVMWLFVYYLMLMLFLAISLA